MLSSQTLPSSNTKNKNNPTATAIEKALEANIKLQKKLQNALHDVARQKHQNRHTCLALKVGLSQHWEQRDAERNRLSEEEEKEAKEREKKNKKRKHPDRWGYNEERKWTRRFFADPVKGVPEDNEDTIQRRLWEGRMGKEDYCRFLPWTQKEMDLLVSCVEEVKQGKAQVVLNGGMEPGLGHTT